jgi:hypothetical protein
VLIPNAEQAVIDPAKLRGYLLSATHPVGRFKARFFARLGYSADGWQQLDQDLRHQHLSQPARRAESTRYGQKYEIRAMLKGPNGQMALVVSVWLLPARRDIPRFVTAYPGETP